MLRNPRERNVPGFSVEATAPVRAPSTGFSEQQPILEGTEAGVARMDGSEDAMLCANGRRADHDGQQPVGVPPPNSSELHASGSGGAISRVPAGRSTFHGAAQSAPPLVDAFRGLLTNANRDEALAQLLAGLVTYH